MNEDIHRNIYKIGDVITAIGFSVVVTAIAFMVGFGFGETTGQSHGRLLELHEQQQLKAKP